MESSQIGLGPKFETTVKTQNSWKGEDFDNCPAALRDALMRIVQELTNQIRAYDKAITKKAEQEYPETAAILTIPGVGPLTALTFTARYHKSG